MIARAWSLAGAAACAAGSLWLAPPTPAALREVAAWLVRPAVLPFAWAELERALATGDGGEAFARAQQLASLLPTWTDGQVVFAYRFALDGGDAGAPAAARARAAADRLEAALAWLDASRATAGRFEVELLQAMALLPEVAVHEEPGLAELLRPAGGPAAIADRWLEAAERIGGPAVREQRTFAAPWLCAGFLGAGDRARAVAVLDAAIARSRDVRDAALATEWRSRLAEVRQALLGEPVDLAAVRADTRFERLLPWLER